MKVGLRSAALGTCLACFSRALLAGPLAPPARAPAAVRPQAAVTTDLPTSTPNTGVPATQANPRDSFAGIKTRVLRNGLTVMLFPSPNTGKVGVQVLVNAGMNEEKQFGEGVAHLTEHSVFRDPKLGAESYLDILRRDGASDLNATTSADTTLFHASVPAAQGNWLVGKFGELFQRRDFDIASVDKCKEEIALELSSRSAMAGAKSPEEQFLPIIKQEFGVSSTAPRSSYDLGRISTATKSLTNRQVKAFFERHYIPVNMLLTVVGTFDEAAMWALIDSTFGKIPRPTAGPRTEPAPTPRLKPFFFSYPSMTAYVIQIGTKFWGITAKNELILRAYVEDLALRLMQTLRSRSAQTYTVSPFTYMDTRRFGLSLITFETSAEKYGDNYSYVTDLVDSETLDGQLSDADIARIRKLYAQHFSVVEPDVKGLTEAANQLYAFQTTYRTTETPFAAFQSITNSDFRNGLAQLFDPDRRFTFLLEPPILFKFEWPLLSIAALLYSFFMMRTLFRRPINESSGIRFTEKIHYSLMTRFTLAVSLFILVLALGLLHTGLRTLEADWFNFRGAFVLSQYVQGVVVSCLTLCSILYFFTLIPRRILINDRHFIVKSRAFRAWVFPLNSLQRIEICHTSRAFLRMHKNARLVHFGLFKKGVWLDFKNGSSFFVGFRSPEKAVAAIRAACGMEGDKEPDQTGTYALKKSA